MARLDDGARTYDGLLILAFGGPEGPDDVRPFLRNVLRGRAASAERMEEVAQHYLHFGGASPINAQNRALMADLMGELTAHGYTLPLYFGNRNWHPLVGDTVRRMREHGIRRALVFVTSAFSSYSGCRQYREDLERARATVGAGAPVFDKLRAFYNHPDYVAACADRLREAVATLPAARRRRVTVVFTAHSIPVAMARHAAYAAQVADAARLVSHAAGVAHWRVAYQSRSGPPQVPWLEPDVREVLTGLAHEGADAVVLHPIGFLSDHMEVLYDLDVEAKAHAAAVGLACVRAATAGTHPRFVRMIRLLVEERLSSAPVRQALGARGPSHDVCPATCCLAG